MRYRLHSASAVTAAAVALLIFVAATTDVVAQTATARFPVLRTGSEDPMVFVWQRFLLDQGLTVPATVTGKHDDASMAATKAFQTLHGLKKIDGIVGPETWAAWDRINLGSAQLKPDTRQRSELLGTQLAVQQLKKNAEALDKETTEAGAQKIVGQNLDRYHRARRTELELESDAWRSELQRGNGRMVSEVVALAYFQDENHVIDILHASRQKPSPAQGTSNTTPADAHRTKRVTHATAAATLENARTASRQAAAAREAATTRVQAANRAVDAGIQSVRDASVRADRAAVEKKNAEEHLNGAKTRKSDADAALPGLVSDEASKANALPALEAAKRNLREDLDEAIRVAGSLPADASAVDADSANETVKRLRREHEQADLTLRTGIDSHRRAQRALRQGQSDVRQADVELRNAQLEHDRSVENEKQTKADKAAADAGLVNVKSEKTAADAALTAAETNLATARTAFSTADVAERTAFEQKADAGATARRTHDDIVSPRNLSANDPIARVSITSYGPGLLLLRGTREDVLVVRETINQIDRSTGQLKVELWTVQISTTGKPEKIAPVLQALEEVLALARLKGAIAFLTLRQALVLEIAERRRSIETSEVAAFRRGDYQLDTGTIGKDPLLFFELEVQPYLRQLSFAGGRLGGTLPGFASKWDENFPLHPLNVTTYAELATVIALARADIRQNVFEKFQTMIGPALVAASQQAEARFSSQSSRSSRRMLKILSARREAESGSEHVWFPETRKALGYIESTEMNSVTHLQTPDQVEFAKVLEATAWVHMKQQLEIIERYPELAREREMQLFDYIQHSLSKFSDNPAFSRVTARNWRVEDDLVRFANELEELKNPKIDIDVGALTSKIKLWSKLRGLTYESEEILLGFQEYLLGDPDYWGLLADPLIRRQTAAQRITELRPRIAAANQMLKRFVTAFEEDLVTQFIRPSLEDIRQIADADGIDFGLSERTSVLATNRYPALVEPKASIEFNLPERPIPFQEALRIAETLGDITPTVLGVASKLAGGVTTPAALANPADLSGALRSGPAAATATDTGTPAELGVDEVGAKLEALIPPPAIYRVDTGTELAVTPLLLPDGQSTQFDIDYRYMTHIDEPVGENERHIPKVERHHVHTMFQGDSYEIRELTRFESSTKLARPGKKVPILGDIPLVGLLFRTSASTASGHQQSVIYVRTVAYPTFDDILGLWGAPSAVAVGYGNTEVVSP